MLFLGQAPPSDAPPRTAGKSEPGYLAEFKKLKAEMDRLQESLNKDYLVAKTEKEREEVVLKATQVMKEKGQPLAEKALALVRDRAADNEAVEVLTWVINYQPESPAASAAAELLARHHLKSPETLNTASRFQQAPMPWTEKLLRRLAEADLPRDRKARALICLAECTKSKAEVRGLLNNLDPAMVKVVEERYGKAYLAEMRAADPAKLEAEAIRLFEEAAQKYGSEKYGSRTIADHVKGVIFEMRNLVVGKQAPDIAGEDIDGKKFKLSDYRGKVVVLDFWGNW
jgi:hypothetical protein